MTEFPFLKDIPDPLDAGPTGRGGSDRLRRVRPPAPTRGSARRRRLAAIGVSVAWLTCHLAIFGMREDLSQLPASYIVVQVVLPILTGAGCLIVALMPGKLGLGLGAGLLGSMAVLGPLSFWLFALGTPPPYATDENPFGFWLGALVCFDITLAWAAAPLLLLSLALRRAFATHAAWRSALVGAALGLVSGAAINLHCSNIDPWHMVAGHGASVVVAVLLGAALVVRWTRT